MNQLIPTLEGKELTSKEIDSSVRARWEELVKLALEQRMEDQRVPAFA